MSRTLLSALFVLSLSIFAGCSGGGASGTGGALDGGPSEGDGDKGDGDGDTGDGDNGTGDGDNGDGDDGRCVPKSCAQLKKDCGPTADGCGNIIECGTCEDPQICGGGGEPNVCGGADKCKAKTCAELGKNCGFVADGCGKAIDCGGCAKAGDICGFGGVPNVCGQPQEDPVNCPALQTCEDVGATCGKASNGCGGELNCGSCTLPETCGGGGVPSTCGAASCTPLTCDSVDPDHCGPISDGCGGELTNCGKTCTQPDTCGGGGVPSRCGSSQGSCTPQTAETLCGANSCGPIADGCGDSVNCGICTGGNTCGGGGTPSECGGALDCTPKTCQSENKNCGFMSDGCGDVVQCGTSCTTLGDTCGGGGVANVCGQPQEDPDNCPALQTCEDVGAECGAVTNGCGGTQTCAACPAGLVCGGGGVANKCGLATCTRLTCNDYDLDVCGTLSDGCGGELEGCGVICVGEESCGRGGVPNKCGSSPSACVPEDRADLCTAGVCGPVSDGCGDTVDCGGCTGGNTCGGGGTPSMCGGAVACTPKDCATEGKNCGFMSDGCGGVVQCGTTCSAAGDTCGGGGEPNVCGHPAEDPDNCPALRSCETAGAQCGTISNGCGGFVSCGGCDDPNETCGGGGAANQCGQATCVPLTCAAYPGNVCGKLSDGCGGELTTCGVVCTGEETCGGGGTPSRCGSTPSSCVANIPADVCTGAAACGPRPDGCGETVNCGGCATGTTCGGGGVPGQCGAPVCQPRTCASLGMNCGTIFDGCGGTELCGTCTGGNTCGGGGVAGQCGAPSCTPRSCAAQGISCGAAGDGCGGLIADCGACNAPGESCGGGDVPSQCGAPNTPPCVPDGESCAALGWACGTAINSCGQTYDCAAEGRTCGPFQVCEGGIDGPTTCGTGSGGGNCPLCPAVPSCPAATPTRLTGRVTTAGRTDGNTQNQVGVPNAVVYIPRSTNPANLPAITTGVSTTGESCDRCTDQSLGAVMASAVTDARGNYVLQGNIPLGVNFLLVTKVGKFRRAVTMRVEQTSACEDFAVPRSETRLPRSMSDGVGVNIPKIAIATGEIDAMECVFEKIGLTAEMTRPQLAGRVHLYRPTAGGAWPDNSLYECNRCGTGSGTTDTRCRRDYCHQDLALAGTGAVSAAQRTTLLNGIQPSVLYGSAATLSGYDMAVFDCMGQSFQSGIGGTANGERLRSYLNRGGRMFASHLSYSWLSGNGSQAYTAANRYTTGLNAASTWHGGTDTSGTGTGRISFLPTRPRTSSRIASFGTWMVQEGVVASATGTGSTFSIPQPRSQANVLGASSEEFVYQTDGNQRTQQFSFSTPYGAPAAAACGRVAYSGFHVMSNSGGNTPFQNAVFPNHCSGNLNSQEKVLLFSLFDLGACVGGDTPTPPSCTPLTCDDDELADTCGVVGNGCGGTLNCGACPNGESCVNNQCVDNCAPRTCAEANANCGAVADGCGGTLENCGTCPQGQVCGGGGTPNQCGAPSCSPLSCQDVGATCGSVATGCGNTIDCGPCTTAGETCGGGGTANQCGVGTCTRLECTDVGATCGDIGDGCGGTLNCGDCVPPFTCGGGGTPSQCGGDPCVRRTCGAGACGFVADGCGEVADCGGCPQGQVCGGGGTPNQCGTNCDPLTCEDFNADCGLIGDGCGNTVFCGPCDPGTTCGGGGTANQCGEGPGCTKTSCEALTAECGYVGDGCGGSLFCGDCTGSHQTCGGGGVAYQCGGSCTAITCNDVGATCGKIGDGCGRILECGDCTEPGESCGGGGTANVCGGDPCVRKTCAGEGAECGFIADGCGGTVPCGPCAPGEICGGDGEPNQCGNGCQPLTCDAVDAECGFIGNGCDNVPVDCGPCDPGKTCGGDGVPNKCGEGPDCTPTTCAAVGAQCGAIGDGCGGALNCPPCPAPQVCGGSGVPNQCGGCIPRSCADAGGANCGSVGDGCGGILDCGTCTPPTFCGGGGTANVCGGTTCTKLTCEAVEAECGYIGDGCGDSVNCGPCPPGQVCGGGGEPNKCASGCTPLTCANQNAECGLVGNGCGASIGCGPCPAGETCGGGGEPNRCAPGDACQPLTCNDLNANCGAVGDGCGALLNCGTCPAGQTCGGGGTPYQCGGGCTKLTCAQVGADCGAIGDGCGGLVQCGDCLSGEMCGVFSPNKCAGLQ